MRGFSLGAIALVAACGSDGVFIEVRVPDGMTVNQVDLYLATSSCDGDADGFCDGIVPPATANESRRLVEGEVYFVDNDRLFSSTPDADGSAWFVLDSAGSVEIKAAIAVGHDPMLGATGVAIFEQAIDLGATRHYRIDLHEVRAQEVGAQDRAAVERWGPTDDRYRCLAAQDDGRTIYVVPSQDPDCDQVANECLPGVYLGKDEVSTQLDGLSCAAESLFVGACVLGDRGCDETQPILPDQPQCPQTSTATFCVPDRVCACEDGTIEQMCLASLFLDPNVNGGTHVLCTIEVGDAPRGGKETCRVAASPAALASTTCLDPQIAIAKNAVAGFAGSVQLQPVEGKITLKPTVAGACLLGLEVPKALFVPAPPPPLRTLVKLQASDPGAPAERFVILPLKVVFVDAPLNDCAQATEMVTRCELLTAPDEHVGKCFE